MVIESCFSSNSFFVKEYPVFLHEVTAEIKDIYFVLLKDIFSSILIMFCGKVWIL